MKRDLIIGAKGEQRTPKEATDTLYSTQYAQITDVLCEGEIVGLKNGLRSIFVNETPLQNEDGTFNFQNVAVQHRVGTVDQTPVEGAAATEVEIAVATELKHGDPLTRTVTTQNVKRVRITVGVPQLTSQNIENGDLSGTTVALKIQVQSNGTGFKDAITDVISGKTTSRYQKQYLMTLPGEGPWDIRLIRETPDSTSSALVNKTVWDGLTEIIPARLAYPNTALVYMHVDAANFGSIPNRAYLIRGLIVKVPSNYDPEARTYDGIWDGTFKLAWTNNPAWCYYDLITNERYGLGRFIKEAMVDKWALYSVARYCDGMVSDGKGGLEPRFVCNLYLQSREDALTVLQHMASIFRAISLWTGGTIMPIQDRPSDPIALFTNANVEDGQFTYSGTSMKQRRTVALVAWNDPDDFYRQKVEYVQDDAGIQQFGVQETEVTAFGCTSQSQAHRLGKWTLATEQHCNETISFKTGLEGCTVFPGAVFQTSDYIRAGKRMGGRVLAAPAQDQIVVDAPFSTEPGHTYRVAVMLPDGAIYTRDVMATGGDRGATLTLSAALPELPQIGAIWIATDLNTVVAETWRCVSVLPGENNTVEITALNYVADLYDGVEQDIVIERPPISYLNRTPPTPTDCKAVANHYRVSDQIAGLRALVSWDSPLGKFKLEWRKRDGNWEQQEVNGTSYLIESVDAGTYDFILTAISATGRESIPAVFSADLQASAEEAIAIPAPLNLRLESAYTRSDAIFLWDPVPGALGYQIELGQMVSGNFAALRQQDVSNTLRYVYTPDDMRADGGPYRSLTARVRAYTVFGKTSDWITLTVGNPQVPLLSGIMVKGGIKMVFFDCTPPTDPDFAGIILWVGATPDFVPSDANQVYAGATTYAAFDPFTEATGLSFDPDQTYYLKAAGYDTLGKDNLNISPSVAFNVLALAPDVDSIIADMIKDGALTMTKFASGLEPVGIYDALPAVEGYSGPKNIAVNGKLYALLDGVWVANVAEVGPGSITEISLDPELATRIDLIDGPEATPGTVANRIATEVQEASDLLQSNIDYIGAITQTAVAAAQTAIRASAATNSAVTTRTDAIAARLTNDINAAVFAESEARATELQSIATQVNGLSAQWTQDINGSITNYHNTTASQNFATATSVSQLSTTVGGHTTTIQQQATSINGLKARVETKIDADGVITGYALDVDTTRTGAPTSTMTFAVDAFRVQGTGANATAATAIFEIVNTGQTKYVRINGVMIKDGTLSADKIVANSITSAQIAAGAITATQIAAGAITTDAIVVGTNGGVPGTLIKDGAISTAKIATGAITSDRIAANQIASYHILANQINSAHIAANQIEAGHIKSRGITADRIDGRGLAIEDEAGNVIFANGTALDFSRIGGATKPAANATRNTGPFAVLADKVTSSNVADLFAANSIPSTYIASLAADKILAGTLAAGVIYGGTISGDKVSGGTIYGARLGGGTGLSPSGYGFEVTGTSSFFTELRGNSCTMSTNYGNVAPNTATLVSSHLMTGIGVIGYGTGSSNCGVEGSLESGGSGRVGTASYDFYASGPMANYGPFTGAHDGLVPNEAVPELGDLMIDASLVTSKGWSNGLFVMERSSLPYQKGVRGPVSAVVGPLHETEPAAFIEGRATIKNRHGDLTQFMPLMSSEYYALGESHTVITVNGVGEGMIKVCGEGGPISADDLLVTASLPGVAQRQNVRSGGVPTDEADDLIRSFTVAKARVNKGEVITFSSPEEVKVIPCIYLSA